MLSSHSGANMPETKCHPWANMHGTMSSRGIYAWTQRAVLNPETQCFLIILHNATLSKICTIETNIANSFKICLMKTYDKCVIIYYTF